MDKITFHTEQRKISDLIPATYNPRKMTEEQVKQLVASLEKFDLAEIPVINTDNTILAGHQRLKIMSALGRANEVIDVRVPNRTLTEEECKEYNIRSNKNTGEWDFELLANNFDTEMLLDIGFTELELGMDTFQSEPEDDEIPQEPVEQKTQFGDLYELGNHRVLCADSTDIKAVEFLMNSKKADMIFTDPPYGINVVKSEKVGADFGIAKKGKYSQVIADDTTNTACNFYNTCVDIGFNNFIIWGGNYFIDFLPFSDSWIIWDKRGDSGIKNTFADAEMAWCSFHTPVRVYTQLWNGMIREGEKEKRFHPTQKPIRVLSEIIKNHIKGQIILDGFLGSGSILIACEKTNKSCYGIEIDPKYVDVIVSRWCKYTGNIKVIKNGKEIDWVV